MEYLEIRGAVKLKTDANIRVVSFVLNKLKRTKFCDSGSINIHSEGRVLNISANGTIIECYSTQALLTTLQSQLTESSMMSVSSTRWETLMVLKYLNPMRTVHLKVIDQLALAQ